MSSDTGKIILIIGPMFAGKSSELLRRIRRAEFANKNCLLIKYAKDIRYGKGVITHDSVKREECIECNDLLEVIEMNDKGKLNFDNIQVIGIDEGSFIKNIELADYWANLGKTVIIAALDADYKKNPFQSIVNLVAKSEKIIKLSAICKCGHSAHYSKRITTEDSIEVIGGKDKYVSTCRNCFNSP